MRRFLLPAMLLGLIAVPSAAPAASYKVGISDQNPSTFANPLFAPLKLGMARYVTPWDVMSSSVYSSTLNDWITQAVAGHQRILIAFQASRVPGKQRKAPSVAAYTKAIKAFHSKYPFVKDVQPWNEVNRCQETNAAGFVVGEPICHNPKRAAQYYMAARKVFKGAKITGLDILDQANVKPAVRYVKKFLKYAKPKPKFWGFHNYSDTNRFDTKRTKALLKATKSGDVWLTETGGIVALGSSFPYSTKRAAKALGCMFTLAKSNKRITRLYVYQFFGIPKSSAKLFDAGLINPNNTKRPGYDVVRKRKAGRCHK